MKKTKCKMILRVYRLNIMMIISFQILWKVLMHMKNTLREIKVWKLKKSLSI